MTDEGQLRDVGDVVEPQARSGLTLTPGTVLAALALALWGIFVFQNLDSSFITFLGYEAELPRWLLSLIVFVLGVVVGYVAKARRERRKRKVAISS